MIQNKIRKKQIDYTWPGFVDALSSLLMVIIFVLMIFVLSQFFLSQKMSGQDEALVELRNNLIELSQLLSLERDTTTELTTQLSILETKIVEIKDELIKEKKTTKQYQEQIRGKQNIIALNESEIINLKKVLEDKIRYTSELRDKVYSLEKKVDKKKLELKSKDKSISSSKEEINKLISASINLKNKLSQLQTLLSAYKAKDKKEKVNTLNLGKDVNSALAKAEAQRSGVQEAILLDHNGTVAECTGQNIFVVKKGNQYFLQKIEKTITNDIHIVNTL